MSTLTSKIQALLTYANAKTGKSEITLGDAIRSLVDGYSDIPIKLYINETKSFVGVDSDIANQTIFSYDIPTSCDLSICIVHDLDNTIPTTNVYGIRTCCNMYISQQEYSSTTGSIYRPNGTIGSDSSIILKRGNQLLVGRGSYGKYLTNREYKIIIIAI